MLVECVSKGGNLLLNVGPTALGEFPAESVERLQTVGAWLDRNGDSIYGCGNARLPKPEWGRYTRNGNTLYAHIFNKPPARLLCSASKTKSAKPGSSPTAPKST
jgi:alpha-L-fucosidase